MVAGEGGPKFLVRPGVNGYVASDPDGYVHAIVELSRNSTILERMKLAARVATQERSWEQIFQSVYDRYAEGIASGILTNARPDLSKGGAAMSAAF